MRKPNLLILGAMKAATTSLHFYLDRHPEIYLLAAKETDFFAHRRIKGVLHVRSEDQYLKLFSSAPASATYLGESSPTYTTVPLVNGTAERIFKFNPNMKLVYLMRDPVERIISHYLMRVRRKKEHRPLYNAIRSDPIGLQLSHYSMQLAPYLNVFPKEQIFITTSEHLGQSRDDVTNALLRWLNIDPEYQYDPATDRQKFNVAETSYYSNWMRSLARTEPLKRIIKGAIPADMIAKGEALISRPAPHLSDLDIDDLNRTRAYLRPICRIYTDELCQLLGRDFPEWTSLYE